MTTLVHWTKLLQMSLLSEKVMWFELVMWPFQTILFVYTGKRAAAVLLPHEAK